MSIRTEYSYAEIQDYEGRGRGFRAEAPARVLYAAAREIGRFARATFGFVAEASRTVAANRRRARYRADTVQALSRLPDHVLKDIGIHRSQIGAIAESKARRAVAAHAARSGVRTRRNTARGAPATRANAHTVAIPPAAKAA